MYVALHPNRKQCMPYLLLILSNQNSILVSGLLQISLGS